MKKTENFWKYNLETPPSIKEFQNAHASQEIISIITKYGEELSGMVRKISSTYSQEYKKPLCSFNLKEENTNRLFTLTEQAEDNNIHISEEIYVWGWEIEHIPQSDLDLYTHLDITLNWEDLRCRVDSICWLPRGEWNDFSISAGTTWALPVELNIAAGSAVSVCRGAILKFEASEWYLHDEVMNELMKMRNFFLKGYACK